MTHPPSGDQAGPPVHPPAQPDPASQSGAPGAPRQSTPTPPAGQPPLPAPPARAALPAAPTSAAAPTSGTPNPSSFPPAPPAYPPYQGTAEPKKKRGLLIAAIALVVIMVLCVGGGVVAFLTLRNAETGEGAKEPAVAVDEFLTAIYKDRDATKAASHVCAAARDDDKIAAKVAEVDKYASAYQNPRFRWTTPKVDNQTGERATVSTRLTMTTADEKVADQELRFTVVQKTGWWVCEVA
ncbi:Rv0361 family membrane protein [Micromonospora parva]